MKLILLSDVKNIGKKNELVTVADGYARNFLLPRRLAVEATDKSMEILQKQKADKVQEEAEHKKEAQELAKKLESITLEFPVKTGENGRVFGSVSTKAVVEQLEKQYNITIDKRKIKDAQPLALLGLNTIEIELFKGVIGKISVRLKAIEQ